MSDDKLTMKDMCEKIVEADFLCKEDGTRPTAREIYEYSPSGELSQVFAWYEASVALLEWKASTIAKLEALKDQNA